MSQAGRQFAATLVDENSLFHTCSDSRGNSSCADSLQGKHGRCSSGPQSRSGQRQLLIQETLLSSDLAANDVAKQVPSVALKFL
jgi:hypothetical protein